MIIFIYVIYIYIYIDHILMSFNGEYVPSKKKQANAA